MPRFGDISRARLETCHPDLILLMEAVVAHYDICIICGHRDEKAQRKAVEERKSKVMWPNSKHNTSPSMAVDVAPWPLDWSDAGAFYMMVGWIRCTADRLYREGKMQYRIRVGADWDGDRATKDQTFHDTPHIELELNA